MATVKYSEADLKAANELVNEGPVFMVNMLRYRDQAEYTDGTQLPPCTGREAYYQRYVPAFNKVAQGEVYELSWVGHVRAVLVGAEAASWDDIVIVRYATFAAIRRILESPSYKEEAAPHHHAAVADWRFILTTQPDAPN